MRIAQCLFLCTSFVWLGCEVEPEIFFFYPLQLLFHFRPPLSFSLQRGGNGVGVGTTSPAGEQLLPALFWGRDHSQRCSGNHGIVGVPAGVGRTLISELSFFLLLFCFSTHTHSGQAFLLHSEITVGIVWGVALLRCWWWIPS